MIILHNPDMRQQIYDNIRETIVKPREGIHLSDLIYCPRKAYFRKMALSPSPSTPSMTHRSPMPGATRQ